MGLRPVGGVWIMKLKWEDNGIKTPLARARGLGASRGHAVTHWIMQRVTAVAQLFLIPWLVFMIVVLIHALGQDGTDPVSEVQVWLSSGLTPVLMILLTVSITYHAMLGLQVVMKWVVLWGVKLALIFCAAVAIFSVLKVSL